MNRKYGISTQWNIIQLNHTLNLKCMVKVKIVTFILSIFNHSLKQKKRKRKGKQFSRTQVLEGFYYH